MKDFEIVKLTPEEWPAYKELRLEALKTEPQAFGATYAENVLHPDSFWQDRLRDAAPGTSSWLLFAKQGERLVGMLGAFVVDGGTVARVIAVYVRPDARGRGISTRLMTALLSELEQRGGLTKAVLSVSASQAAAMALYYRCGFEMVGQGSLPQEDVEPDIYVMERELR